MLRAKKVKGTKKACTTYCGEIWLDSCLAITTTLRGHASSTKVSILY